MIANLKPYPEYKDSGQHWLGSVPRHWALAPGHSAFRSRKVPNRGLKEKTVLSLSYGRIKVKSTDKQAGVVPESYETYQIVEPGNIIIRGTDLQNDKTSLRIGFARDRGIITSAYLCLAVRESVLPEYGYQLLNAFDLTKAIYRYGSGTRQNLDHGEIKRLPIFLPPLDEQAGIARFLDHANRKIDRFIRAKRKLIALLNEQKQAVIQRAVTRGAVADALLKASHIDGVGDIPGHWEVLRTKHLFRALVRRNQCSADIKLSVTQKHGIVPTNEMSERSNQAKSFNGFLVCEPNDLVLNKYKAHLGVFCHSPVRGVITPNYTVFSPIRDLLSQYYDLLFHTQIYRAIVKRLVYGVTDGMSPLYTQDFYGIPVPFPPRAEQELILAAVSESTTAQNRSIAAAEREILLMQEYRTRLTTDIVTGKLDVRAVAAKLPEIAEEATEGLPLDEADESNLEEVVE